jgi:hypothetical protein
MSMPKVTLVAAVVSELGQTNIPTYSWVVAVVISVHVFTAPNDTPLDAAVFAP